MSKIAAFPSPTRRARTNAQIALEVMRRQRLAREEAERALAQAQMATRPQLDSRAQDTTSVMS